MTLVTSTFAKLIRRIPLFTQSSIYFFVPAGINGLGVALSLLDAAVEGESGRGPLLWDKLLPLEVWVPEEFEEESSVSEVLQETLSILDGPLAL